MKNIKYRRWKEILRWRDEADIKERTGADDYPLFLRWVSECKFRLGIPWEEQLAESRRTCYAKYLHVVGRDKAEVESASDDGNKDKAEVESASDDGNKDKISLSKSLQAIEFDPTGLDWWWGAPPIVQKMFVHAFNEGRKLKTPTQVKLFEKLIFWLNKEVFSDKEAARKKTYSPAEYAQWLKKATGEVDIKDWLKKSAEKTGMTEDEEKNFESYLPEEN